MKSLSAATFITFIQIRPLPDVDDIIPSQCLDLVFVFLLKHKIDPVFSGVSMTLLEFPDQSSWMKINRAHELAYHLLSLTKTWSFLEPNEVV